MRRRTALAAALVLTLAVAASTAGASSTAEPKRYRVALAIEPAGATAEILRLPTAGFRRAVRELPVEGTVVTQPARMSSVSLLRTLARRRYDLIFAIFAFPLGGAVHQVALEFPKSRFALVDAGTRNSSPFRWSPNVQGIAFREQEIGFVVGYLAGLMERRRPGPDVVASVGGLDVPPVARFIAGFRAGARDASPRVRHLNVFTQNFVDPAVCRNAAVGLIAKGAGVVFQVAGGCGVGVFQAAAERGVFAIGVDSDQSSYGAHVLTSAVKRLDLAVYRTIELLVDGRLRPAEDTTLGVADGALSLGRFSPRVPPDVRRKTKRVLADVARGRVPPIPETLASS